MVECEQIWVNVVLELTDKEQLIYDLMFIQKTIFNIDLQRFCTFDTRPKFRDEIRTILKRGRIKILDDRIIHTDESVVWKIEIKRN